VFVRIGNILLIAAMLTAINGHWAVLQSVAWTTMLADNLRHDSFTEAVQCTFDGKHPCCLCKAITAGKQTEKKTEFALSMHKIEFLPMKAVPAFIPPPQFLLLACNNTYAVCLTSKPPVPPPRGICA
jgi:hypothetical protein